MIFRLLILLVSAISVASCVPSETPSPIREVSIAHLKSLCEGDHHRIKGNIAVRGVVVATDWLGELHKSAVIVDDTGGLEFGIDLPRVSDHIPISSEVVILCDGLMLARVGGKIQLGLPPTADFPIDNIDQERFSRYIRVVARGVETTAKLKRFADVGVNDISDYVRFERVRIASEQRAWCDFEDGSPVTTYHTMTDSEGNEFALCVLSTCYYADEPMPTNEVSVAGVIDYSDNRYFLRIVNATIQ